MDGREIVQIVWINWQLAPPRDIAAWESSKCMGTY